MLFITLVPKLINCSLSNFQYFILFFLVCSLSRTRFCIFRFSENFMAHFLFSHGAGASLFSRNLVISWLLSSQSLKMTMRYLIVINITKVKLLLFGYFFLFYFFTSNCQNFPQYLYSIIFTIVDKHLPIRVHQAKRGIFFCLQLIVM